MFETKTQQDKGEIEPFLAWFSRYHTFGQRKAEALCVQAINRVPGFARFAKTAQGGPWHCEGPHVIDHIMRILTTLYAIEAGAPLEAIEEFARERDLALDVKALKTTICMHAPLLAAFAVAHDLAKPDTLFFDAAPETRGAQEGFVQHDKRQQRSPSDSEVQRYDKLFRAFAVNHSGSIDEQVAGFFETYGIATHYYGHASVATSQEYAAGREAALDIVGVPRSYHRLLTELIRQHIDVLGYFRQQPDAKKYEFLAALAGRLGLNVDLYLDLTIAEVFLDAVAGSLQVQNGKLQAQTDLVVHILKAEREALPRRHALREEHAARQEKQAYKDLLASVGLSGDEVFALLGTPIGPERGEVMAKVHGLLRDPSSRVDFGEHTAEIVRRVAAARSRLGSL